MTSSTIRAHGLAGDNTENDLTIFLGSLIQATDFDGDTAPGGAVQIVVNDDTPIATAGTSTGTVDEDGFEQRAVDGIGGGDGDWRATRRRRLWRRCSSRVRTSRSTISWPTLRS